MTLCNDTSNFISQNISMKWEEVHELSQIVHWMNKINFMNHGIDYVNEKLWADLAVFQFELLFLVFEIDENYYLRSLELHGGIKLFIYPQTFTQGDKYKHYFSELWVSTSKYWFFHNIFNNFDKINLKCCCLS